MRVAYVFKSWRGDSEVTTAADVLDKYKELAGEMVITLRQADPRAVDFHTIAIRSGLPFGKAESKHEIGEGVISTLFKNGMLYLFDEPEIRKIGNELSSLRYETKKSVAKDDSIDSLRYILPAIPFDWGIIMDRLTEADKTKAPPVPETPYQAEMRMRRGEFYAKREDGVGDWDDVEAEIEEWNAFSEGVG
jgi:hypothetical protein